MNRLGFFRVEKPASSRPALPYQEQVYRAWSQETGKVSFVRRRLQDPVFAAYRYLARESDAAAVWQVDRAYHGLPATTTCIAGYRCTTHSPDVV